MRFLFLFLAVSYLTTTTLPAQPLTLPDIMQFKSIESPILSNDGSRLAFTQVPDRGDPEVIVFDLSSKEQQVFTTANNPAFSADGTWLAIRKVPSLQEKENAEDGDALKNGLILINLETNETEEMENVKAFSFSEERNYLSIHFGEDEEEDEDNEQENSKLDRGTPLMIVILDEGTRVNRNHVRTYSFSPDGTMLVLSEANAENEQASLTLINVPSQGSSIIEERERGVFGTFSWNEEQSRLAYISAEADSEGNAHTGRLMHMHSGGVEEISSSEWLEEGWGIPAKNDLTWSEDGQRLFVGLKPVKEAEMENEEEVTDPYSIEELLQKKELDVWHWNDPLINSNQKKQWEDNENRTYLGLYHFDEKKLVALANEKVPDVEPAKEGLHFLGKSDIPYLKEITWGERHEDLYSVDGMSGEKTLIAKKVTNDAASMSPGGNHVLYYSEGDWHLFTIQSGNTRNLTENLPVPFADEDYDYPQDIPGYGSAGWIDDDSAVLIYDKYDIWMIPTADGTPFRLTEGAGRNEKRIFRIIRTDPEKETFGTNETILLSSYHDLEKNDGFYSGKIGEAGISRLLESPHQYAFHGKARDSDTVLISREAYDEFPDLWVTDSNLRSPEKITNVNPIVSERDWGTSELVEWASVDGIPLQGVVIKPGDYDPEKKYPVLVYFYRFMSQRLHQFNQLHINHRPAFEWYASNDYIIFLPDVRFEIGRPGFSALKCIVPGVQKLIDMGIADPEAIGLHGHSWSGYQTAYIVTQTDFLLLRLQVLRCPI